MVRKYALYLVRWQLSTPILAVVLIWLSEMSTLWATVIANLIGGAIFFWVDRFIFRSLPEEPLWEIKEGVYCEDCGIYGQGFRIVEWLAYNRRGVREPQYRCSVCKDVKANEVKRGLKGK